MIGAACLECGEPATEAGELIRRQLGNSFGDFFDFHVAQYSTAAAWLNEGKELGARARLLAERVCLLGAAPHVRGMTRSHLPAVVLAKAGTHDHRPVFMGPSKSLHVE